MPPTIAGSSRNERSPCSSWNRSKAPAMTSSACGRVMFRAVWTASHGVVRRAVISEASTMRPASAARCPLPAVEPAAGGRSPPTMRSIIDTSQAPAEVLAGDPEGVQEESDPLLELVARDDLIDEAVLEEELRALEAGRQLLADRLAGHARAREADERSRLREDDVAERRERGEHAARRGVGEHGDERDAGGVEARDRADRLGHLHERDRALLHPRAAGGGDDDERLALRERPLGGAGDLLAHDAAHRAAHELEVHHREHDGDARERRVSGDDRVAAPGLRLRGRDPFGIRLAVDEAERIGRGESGVGLPERARVRQELDALLCPELEVVPALRAHVEVPRELLVEQHLAAARALRPEVRGEFLRPPAERVAKPHASGGQSPPGPPKLIPLPNGTSTDQ